MHWSTYTDHDHVNHYSLVQKWGQCQCQIDKKIKVSFQNVRTKALMDLLYLIALFMKISGSQYIKTRELKLL